MRRPRERGGPGREVPRALHRRLGVERETRRATFPVDVETKEQRARRELRWRRIRWTGKPWTDLSLAHMRLLETMANVHHHTMDAVLEQQRRQTAMTAQRVRALFVELATMCEDGLRMQTDAARATMELRVRERIEQARARFDAKLWDALAPALDVALGQVKEMMKEGPGARPATLLPRGRTARTCSL